MAHKPYHHGNLEESLIETGIALIDKEGVQNFSLRKVAAACGVSHTAPYKHYPDKEALLAAMQGHVAERFAFALEQALAQHEGDPDRMIFLAQAYVNFFTQNPQYFRFFITQSGGEIDLSNLEAVSDYRPFEVYKAAAMEEMELWGIPHEYRAQELVAMWAMVHGVTMLATMQGVRYDGDWGQMLASILKQNTYGGESNI